ncbi:MAG TPA: transposase [Terracidiphilus sp.]
MRSAALNAYDGGRTVLSLALLDRLEERIAPPDKAVSQATVSNAEACLLMTHPGVGPVISLAYALTIGNWQRFQRGKQVGSYLPPQRRRPVAGDPGLGLIPAEESSGEKRRLGRISKQGNTLVRWLLVEAASTAQRYDPSWHRQYVRLSMSKHHGVAKVAIAHKLAVRLYWMLRSGEDFEHVMERGSTARQSECPGGRSHAAD